MKKLLLLLLSCMFLGGCLGYKSVKVDIDSYASRENNTVVIGTRYVLIPYDNIDIQDLQFIEFAEQIETLLKNKGMVRIYEVKKADTIVMLKYQVSSTDIQKSYQRPIYGQIGVSKSTTNSIHHTDNLSTHTTTHTPTYGITGYETDTIIYTDYNKVLELRAVRIKNGKLGDPLWQISAQSIGSMSNLRAVFPALTAAIKDYIAVRTQKNVIVYIDKDNPNIIIKVE